MALNLCSPMDMMLWKYSLLDIRLSDIRTELGRVTVGSKNGEEALMIQAFAYTTS